MAALSYYSNWETFHQHEYFNSDMSISALAETELIPPEPFNNFFEFPDDYCSIDFLFGSNDFLHSQNYMNSPLPPHHNLRLRSLPESEPFHCPKRQKVYDYEQIYTELQPAGITDGPQEYFPPEAAIPALPDFSTAPVYSNGSGKTTTAMTKEMGGGSFSAQSIAARQRRRRISEKTHELGKLIPGGPRMNTAEMFGAAYKYIKYLQAQIGILEFANSCHQENGDLFRSEELQGLLESPLIQEKLYSMEKCLVPEKFMQEPATDDCQVFESRHRVFKQVQKIIAES